MKKFLLASLMLFAIGGMAANAQTTVFYESFDQCAGTGGNDGLWSGNIASHQLVTDNEGWVTESAQGANQCAKFGASKKIGNATTPALSFEGDATLTFRAGSWAGDATELTLSISSGSLSESSITLTESQFTDYTVQITGASNGSTVSFSSTGNKKRFFLDEVRVTVGGEVEFTPAPTFSPAGGTYYSAQSVTLSAVDGASIYYTTNGDEPTTSSTLYSAPIEVATTTTIKAIAVLNDVESSVAEATYTIESVTSVANIAAFLATAEGTVVCFTNPVTVSFQDGSYTFVQDETGSTLIYGNIGIEYADGDVIPAGFTGTRSAHQGVPQLADASSFAEATENNGEVVPTDFEVAAVTTDLANQYIKVSNVTIGSEQDGDYTNWYAYSGSDKVMIYARFSTFTRDDLAALEADKEYDLTGFVTIFNGQPEIYIVSITEPGGEEPGPDPSGDVFFEESFGTSQGDFVIQDVELGTLGYVWKYDETYNYMKASAFVGGAVAAESWLVSPEIDLTDAATVQLQFDEIVNHLYAGNIEELCKVMISTDYVDNVTTASWTQVTPTGRASGSSWTPSTVDPIDLAQFAGSKIRLGFCYISTAEIAPTWEIYNIVVKGTKGAGVEDAVAEDGVKVLGLDGEIAIVGEASDVEVYNMGGALIAKGNLTSIDCAAGVYIVKVDGNAQKVIVK